MIVNELSETWKTVVFDFDFTNDFKLEVSNLGRIRSSNKIAVNKILKGALINNYRVICMKFYKPRTAHVENQLAYLKLQLSKITTKLAQLKRKNKSGKNKNQQNNDSMQEVKELQSLYDGLNKKYRKLFDDDLKQRTMSKTLLAHRLVAENFCEKKSESHNQVTHIDHDRLNNRADNLKWVTQEELNIHQKQSPNVQRAYKERKGKRNENAETYKLTSTKVMLIKKKINNGVSLQTLSKTFKVTQTQLRRIKNGVNWGDVQAAK